MLGEDLLGIRLGWRQGLRALLPDEEDDEGQKDQGGPGDDQDPDVHGTGLYVSADA